MKTLTLKDILYIHESTIKKHGGTNGIKSLDLIRSSLNSGFATFNGKYLYKSIEEKIAVISYSFIKNHGFEDGNKRVGCLVLLTLCYKNDLTIKPTQQELINLGLGVAEGKLNKKDILSFIFNTIK